jgi:hypothetical protein
MYFHDLWEYVERKMSQPDGATVLINHPESKEQHASVPDHPSHKPYQQVRQSLEIDTINEMILELQKLIDDEYTPEDVKK